MSTAAVASAEPSNLKEFLAWTDEDVWAEWVDGKVLRMAPATDRHQDLVRFLSAVLSVYIEANDLGWLRSAPFSMYLAARHQVREPDLLFVVRDRMHLVKNAYLDGPADAVIELVSRDSHRRDRIEKVADYEAAGVREYWLIDPRHRQVEFRRLDEAGFYRLVTLEEGIFTSEVIPGFRLRVDWLWREPLPKVLDAVRELGLI